VHRPRRMVVGDVQRREVVEVVLYFRAVAHLETGLAEQRLDALQRARDGMQPADVFTAPGQRDVNGLGGE